MFSVSFCVEGEPFFWAGVVARIARATERGVMERSAWASACEASLAAKNVTAVGGI